MDSKAVNKLKIFKNEILVGNLERTNDGCCIELTDEFKKTKKNLTFKISSEEKKIEFKGVGLPPYFAGLLPEGLRLKALIKRLKTSQDDLFSILVASGGQTIGDIHFENDESLTSMEDLLNDFNSIKEQLHQGQDPGHNAIAGVQDKLSADRISLPTTIKKRNKSYILKLTSTEFPEVIQNEWQCIEIAKACGLSINKAQIVKDAKQNPALLVERFDREWNKLEKKWQCFHQEDACQFLNRYPADKYRLTFQEIADEVANLATSPEIEVLNLLKLKAFSYLIGNGDLHAKNISLTQKSESDICKLTPCYDLVCTALYGDQKMALMFLGKNQNLKKKNFIEFGQRYDIPEAATVSMLEKLVSQFEKNYQHFFSFPLAKKKGKFLNQFFKERIKHLL
ncbi:MAG: HipA domain-containing protein [Deltaproteobacteria bacterium]|nr:HipA domain-containing protein [Deltaproteobacteria bacterium]